MPIQGPFADGTFVEAEFNEQANTLTIGADGVGARARMPNESGTIKITLLQAAAGNDALSTAHNSDKKSSVGVGAFFLKDLFGTTLISADNAWVQKMATVSFGKELDAREWTLECEKLQVFVGGALP